MCVSSRDLLSTEVRFLISTRVGGCQQNLIPPERTQIHSAKRSMAAAADHLSVFIEGTANTLSPVTTQIGRFYAQVQAVEATEAVVAGVIADAQPLRWKLGFDGCGVTNGMAGVIWAFGLSSQVTICMICLAHAHMLIRSAPPPIRIAFGSVPRWWHA